MPIHHSVFKNPFEVKTQNVAWIDDMPHSITYDDLFFQEDAIAEIKNIFIEPNKLEKRFTDDSKITIGDLGFGFGLNFFVTAKIWMQHKDNSCIESLEYIAIEEALPSKEQILRVIKNFPALGDICTYFLSLYDPMHNDMTRIHLPHLNMRLTLIENKAELALENLLGFKNNKIDAWYLDGFDPKKNASMWSSSIAQLIGSLSSESATFGTFTSAGFVKRNLRKFGFNVSKVKGFGAKRHKLIGRKYPNLKTRESIARNKQKIAVIGSGIAGSSAAYAAANYGTKVDVYEFGEGIATGTSSNPVAAMYPRFSSNNSPYAHLIAQSYFFADKLYSQFPVAYTRSGVLFSHSNKHQKEWIDSMMGLERGDIFEHFNQDQMEDNFGLKSEGLKVYQGGYLIPRLICNKLLDHSNIKIFQNHCFHDWDIKNSKITLKFSNQSSANEYDALIIASGPGLLNLIPDLKISKGQLIGLQGSQGINLNIPLNSEGYVLPAVDGVTWVGSTYERDFIDMQPSLDSGNALLSRTKNNFEITLNSNTEMLMEARLRLGTKDRLPIAGKLAPSNNIYVLGALGSRGFSLAPLLGEFLASQIHNSPNPISTGIALTIDPQRFIS
jgi:tRNA 5-methylaminomethyl-2-thiouridine biosynthesis bifunctional protein